MKKIIAIAAIAVVGGVFAECEEPTECVFAYQVSLSGKSTVAASTKAKPSQCIDAECYRKAASFKAKGYIYGTTEGTDANPDECIEGSCGCNKFEEVTSYIWNTKTLKKVGDFKFDSLARIGSTVSAKAKTVEVLASIGDGLTLAGFGKYDTKNDLLKSASGYFAGKVAAPECSTCTYNESTCEDACESTASVAFQVCSDEASDTTDTPAYGKWSVKYSKSAVKKLTKNFADDAIVPAKVLAANAEGEDAP